MEKKTKMGRGEIEMVMKFTRDGSNGDWGSLKMKTESVDGRVAI